MTLFLFQEGGGGSLIWTLLPFVFIFGIFYFLVILPQKKQRLQLQDAPSLHPVARDQLGALAQAIEVFDDDTRVEERCAILEHQHRDLHQGIVGRHDGARFLGRLRHQDLDPIDQAGVIKATVGSLSGVSGAIAINSNITWDYDPSDGIDPGATSFQDVFIHEVGHR